jgi:type IV pilus assembly protein PilV
MHVLKQNQLNSSAAKKVSRNQICRKQTGFSLIEVLVAMVIFAVGFLGLASMQSIALKRNNQADLRTSAIYYANDLIERVRARCGGDCNIAAELGQEIDSWKVLVNNNLPGGGGSGAVENGNTLKVTLYWNESIVRKKPPKDNTAGGEGEATPPPKENKMTYVVRARITG